MTTETLGPAATRLAATVARNRQGRHARERGRPGRRVSQSGDRARGSAPRLPIPAFARTTGGARRTFQSVLLGSYGRPQIRLQAIEKIESAPGIAAASGVAAFKHALRRDAFALLLGMRAEGLHPPSRQTTVARKSHRKPLKRLNPRPGLRRSRHSRAARISGRLSPAGAPAPGRAPTCLRSTRGRTIARKFCCKPLKSLNPRPGLSGSPKRWPRRARSGPDQGPATARHGARHVYAPSGFTPAARACGARPA